MAKSVTHIIFAQGTEIKDAFARAMVPEQRRDPDKTEGYWLVNASVDTVKACAAQHGQAYKQALPDSHFTRT